MYLASEFTKQVYKTGEVAKILGVTVKTVQNYDNEGKLRVTRSEGNRRNVLREDLLKYLEERGILYNDTGIARHDVIYARVSSHDQRMHHQADQYRRNS